MDGMKPRALRSIVQLPAPDRDVVLAEGMSYLVRTVSVLSADADTLAKQRRHQSASVLRGFADEEAAKVLILLDVVRAGWRNHELVKAGFAAFYDHLARGLYVEAYDMVPADVAELRRYLDLARAQFYLDGPLDVDWVFSNWVTTRREEALYVDYIQDENGDGRWNDPGERAAIYHEPLMEPGPSRAVELVDAMNRLGVLTQAGLQTTRSAWNGVIVNDDMRWVDLNEINSQVLQALLDSGHITKDDGSAVPLVLEYWNFPLTGLDLKLKKVELQELHAAREHRLAQEMGGY